MPNKKILSYPALIMIIVTTVYSFSSMSTAFFMMGMKSLPWFLISGLCYFIPYALIVSEYTRNYADQNGGIYSWLQEAFSPKIAFITAFLWYCSYFTWIISLFMKLIIPFSILLFGEDITTKSAVFGISSNLLVAIFAVFAIILMTFLITRGYRTIFSFLKVSSLAMIGLLVLSALSNFTIIGTSPERIITNLNTSLNIPSFFEGTTDHFISQLPFFIFAITAFGGLDTIASLADKTGEQKKKFPTALIISAGIILILYFGGILLWSGANDLSTMRLTDQSHLGNLMYGLMGSLARHLASVLRLSGSQSALLYQIYIRYTAFVLFVSYLGLLSSITYTPLKSLIQGTPKAIWPKKLVKTNHKEMPYIALWLQAAVVMTCVLFLSLNSHFLSSLFNQLTYMTNVSRAIPYFVVAASYPFYRMKKGGTLQNSLVSSDSLGKILAASVCLTIIFAILFQIYQPVQSGDYWQAVLLIIGPVLFGVLGGRLFQRFERKLAAE